MERPSEGWPPLRRTSFSHAQTFGIVNTCTVCELCDIASRQSTRGALISEVEEALITRIELIFAVDPDNHSGSLEWPIVIVLLAASISTTFCALYEWRRVSAATR
jgi:hypothetical protein